MSVRHDSRLEIDHLFVFVTAGAPEAAGLGEAGLRESFRRAHPGQGTANLCFCFDNAYLELLWVTDPAELARPDLARSGFARRADWRVSGASPFGIALRGGALPFATWDYRPDFLPPPLSIAVATDSDDPRQPFLFRSPGTQRPDAWTDGRAGSRQTAAGLTEILAVHLDLPAAVTPAPALRALERAGVITLGQSAAARMELSVARSSGEAPARLVLPLHMRE